MHAPCVIRAMGTISILPPICVRCAHLASVWIVPACMSASCATKQHSTSWTVQMDYVGVVLWRVALIVLRLMFASSAIIQLSITSVLVMEISVGFVVRVVSVMGTFCLGWMGNVLRNVGMGWFGWMKNVMIMVLLMEMVVPALARSKLSILVLISLQIASWISIFPSKSWALNELTAIPSPSKCKSNPSYLLSPNLACWKSSQLSMKTLASSLNLITHPRVWWQLWPSTPVT